MGRNKDNALKAKKQGYIKTKAQLKNWGLKFHKLLMGKPSYDIFIDDKSYGYNDSWIKKLKKLKKNNIKNV